VVSTGVILGNYPFDYPGVFALENFA